MNRYKIQYIVDMIKQHEGFPDCVLEMRPAVLLAHFDFSQFLTAEEQLAAAKELRDLAAAERFKQDHRCHIVRYYV